MTIRAVAVGVEIAPTRKVVYQRALARQSFSDDSIHNDEYTRGKGYPGALVSAYVLAGYMSEPMVAFFGPSWFTTGRIDLTFIGRGVQQGDEVSCRGVVKEVVDEDVGNCRVILDVWMEKTDGTKAVVGEASALWAGRGERRDPVT